MNSKIKYAIIFLVSLLLIFGCKGKVGEFSEKPFSESDIKRLVHVGDTTESVKLHFGEPLSQHTRSDGTIVSDYVIDPHKLDKNSNFGGFTVLVKDNKVVEWSPILYKQP